MKIKQVLQKANKTISLSTANTDDWNGISILILFEDIFENVHKGLKGDETHLEPIELEIRDKEVSEFMTELYNHISKLGNSTTVTEINEFLSIKETLLHFTDGSCLGISFMNHSNHQTQLRFGRGDEMFVLVFENDEFRKFCDLVGITIDEMENTSLITDKKIQG